MVHLYKVYNHKRNKISHLFTQNKGLSKYHNYFDYAGLMINIII